MAVRRKIVRVAGIAALVLLSLAGGVALWFSNSYKGIIQSKLPELSAKATDSLYQIRAGDVDIDFGTRDVTFTDLELQPDAAHLEKLRRDYDLPPVLFTIRIPKVFIRHLSVSRYLQNRELVADELHISDPVIRITRLTAPPREKDTAKKPLRIQMVKAGLITITNPDVRYTDESKSNGTSLTTKGGSIRLTDWRFDLSGERDTTRLFYASRTQLSLKAFGIRDPAGMYGYSAGSLDYDQQSGTFEVSDLRIKPLLSRAAFYRRTGFQKEIYNVRFPTIRLMGLDWPKLVHGKALIAGGGLIRGGNLGMYLDRVPPPNIKSKNGSFPHQVLMKVKMPVYIPRLDVEDGQLVYTERDQTTMQEGTVHLTRIQGRITNVTNIPARIRKSPVCTISLGGDFKGSRMEATFRLPLTARNGAFSVEGSLGAMDGTRLNDITRPLALTHIASMRLNSVRFKIDGDEQGTQGMLTMLYDDMKTQLLEVEGDGRLDKKSATTFLANKLLLYPANPMPRKNVRVANPSVVRDPTKSFFNTIWNTIFNGVVQSMQRRGFVDDAVERKARKQDEKRKKEEPPRRR